VAPFGCLFGQSSQFKARVYFPAQLLKQQGNQERREMAANPKESSISNSDSAKHPFFICGKTQK
jgi:hypothetical protein